jgi:hypothetical protein
MNRSGPACSTISRASSGDVVLPTTVTPTRSSSRSSASSQSGWRSTMTAVFSPFSLTERAAFRFRLCKEVPQLRCIADRGSCKYLLQSDPQTAETCENLQLEENAGSCVRDPGIGNPLGRLGPGTLPAESWFQGQWRRAGSEHIISLRSPSRTQFRWSCEKRRDGTTAARAEAGSTHRRHEPRGRPLAAARHASDALRRVRRHDRGRSGATRFYAMPRLPRHQSGAVGASGARPIGLDESPARRRV